VEFILGLWENGFRHSGLRRIFTGENQFSKKSNYNTWIFNPSYASEQCLIFQHLPEPWSKLKELLQNDLGVNLADLKLDNILHLRNLDSFQVLILAVGSACQRPVGGWLCMEQTKGEKWLPFCTIC
jgi:hypothetical protein